MRKLAMLCVTLMMFVSWADTVGAATTVYTDKTAWENALDRPFLTEDFNDDQLNEGVSFVSGESGHINPAGGYYQDVLTSTSHNEPMTTWSFTPEIDGYGGNWTLGGPGGSGNNLLVYIAGVPTPVGSIPNSYAGGFWGFISDTPFTSVELIGGLGTHQQHYSLDDMVYSPVSEAILCDFTGDDICDVTDLDLMQSLGPIAPGVPATGNEQFDFNGDGIIDLADRDEWLALAATENSFGSPYKLGDANIDGFVDGTDFIAWNGSKFTQTLLWSNGDFTADGFVDGTDFIAWNDNKFTSSDGVTAVPEPGAVMLSLVATLLLGAARRRR